MRRLLSKQALILVVKSYKLLRVVNEVRPWLLSVLTV
jgi:hypothetical protein